MRCVIILLIGAFNLFAQHKVIQWNQLHTLRDSSAIFFYLNALEDSLDNSSPNSQFYLKKLEPIVFQSQNPTLRLHFSFLKGQYYYQRGDYQTALNLYLQCAQTAEQLNLQNDYIRSMSNIATIYARLNNFKESNKQYHQLIPLAKKLSDSTRLLIVYVNLANNFLSLNQLDSAKYYYEQALSLTPPGTFYQAAVEINLSRLHIMLKQPEQARQFAQKSAAIADSLGNLELYVESLTNIVNSYLSEKKYENARPIAQKVEQLAKTHHLKLQLQNAFINLADVYEGLGKYKKSLYYFRKYTELKDSLFNAEMSRQINELKIRFDTQQKEKEILLKETLIRKKELQVRYLLLGIAGTLFFSLIIIWLYSRQRSAYQMLVKKSLQLNRSTLSVDNALQNNSEKKRNINAQKKQQILDRLNQNFIQTKQYLRADISIEKVAAMLGTNSKYLSEVIHHVYGQSFPVFLNYLRIQEAIRLFKEGKGHHYSIEGISQMVGFNSKSTFNAAFKKFTGVTPSYFRREVNRLK